MTATKHSTIRLTPGEQARLIAVAEAQGARGIAGGIRAALVLAEEAIAVRTAKAKRAEKKGATT